MGLDAVEIVLAVEESFEIQIEDVEAENIQTPRQLIDLIQTKVTGIDNSRKKWSREQIASRVKEIVIDVTGGVKDYREDARFVEDIGLD